MITPLRSVLRLLPVAVSVSALAAQAPGDSTLLAWPRAVEQTVQLRLRTDAGKLWGARLDSVPLFLVADQRALLSADPRSEGFTTGADGWWAGALPTGLVVANTAVAWAGRTWAMMMLPLASDAMASSRLVIHERWHVIQPRILPLPAYNQFDPGAELLDQPDGRIWLRLEWAALVAALDARPGSMAERAAVKAALTFRAMRYSRATAGERLRERLLDLGEGMAEYTGWKLSGNSAAELSQVLRTRAPASRSFGRSFAYFTGPGYGYLLDRHASGWRTALRTRLDLQTLLAATLGRDGTNVADWLQGAGNQVKLAAASEQLGRAYGLEQIRREENDRWAEMSRKIGELRERFLKGPTLRIPVGGMGFAFDPTNSTSLGADGTVYGYVEWKGADGAILSSEGGTFANAARNELRVSVDSAKFTTGVLPETTRWAGAGWSLTLPAGWRVEAAGASWLLTPPK
ncbi:MAG: hypothetical protein V4558_15380 [Gemmatimonadota bacterium]